MKNSPFFVGISLLVLLAISGCGTEKYEAEMKEAQTAMDEAKGVFAEELAPSDWLEAMVAWEQAKAAVDEKKPAKTYFLRAKARFQKATKIAKAEGEKYAKQIEELQLSIGKRFDKVQAGLQNRRISSKIKEQLKGVVEQAEETRASIESLAGQGNYLKAFDLAKKLQSELYDAELTLAGKKRP